MTIPISPNEGLHQDLNKRHHAPNDENAVAGIGRRKMLGLLASGAAVLGMSSAPLTAEPGMAMPATREGEVTPDELFAQARLRNYKTRRSSSWDRTGGNGDAVPVEGGASATILEV